MASSTLKEKLAKNLECAICLDAYDDPKVLICQHSYCRKCLEKMVFKFGRVSKITCPECRKETTLQEDGVSGLQSNFLINQLLPLSTSSGGQSNHESPHCDKHHEEKLELYCKICEEPVCQACLEIDHHSHLYTSIKDVFPRKKKIMAKLLNEAKPKISALRAEVLSIEDEEIKVRNNALAVSQEIDTFIDTLINKHTAILERERHRLKQEVQDKASLQLSKLQDQKESLVMTLSSVDFAKRTLNYTDKVQFVRSKKEVTSKITDLRSFVDKFRPCEKVVYKLDKKPPEKEKIEGVGKIKAHGECCLSLRGGEPGILHMGRAWQWYEFVITFNSNEAFDHRNVMNNFKVNILSPNAKMPFSPLVENKGDGTRSFHYRPECSGDHKISICNAKFYRDEIHSSPVIWKVLP